MKRSSGHNGSQGAAAFLPLCLGRLSACYRPVARAVARRVLVTTDFRAGNDADWARHHCRFGSKSAG
jgi:hypothetical protein